LLQRGHWRMKMPLKQQKLFIVDGFFLI